MNDRVSVPPPALYVDQEDRMDRSEYSRTSLSVQAFDGYVELLHVVQYGGEVFSVLACSENRIPKHSRCDWCGVDVSILYQPKIRIYLLVYFALAPLTLTLSHSHSLTLTLSLTNLMLQKTSNAHMRPSRIVTRGI